MSVTKTDIISRIYNQNGVSKAQATEITESLLEILKSALVSGEDVLISGFGKFRVKEKKGRIGRNPQTTHAMMLRNRRVVTFKCSSVLRGKLNTEG